MISKEDREALKSRTDIVSVIGSYVKLTRKGSNYAGCCPFHDERTPSFNVSPSKGIYKCFGCGAAGDVVSFVMEHLDVSIKEAFKIIDGNVPNSEGKDWRALNKPPKDPWIPLPVAATVPTEKDYKHHEYGNPTNVYWYYTEDGGLAGGAARFDFLDGSKEVLPLAYCTNGDWSRWKFRGMATPRPLYGIPNLINKPNAIVLLVEGEKTADYASTLFPNVAVVSWPGGSNAVEYVNWEILRGRKVVLSPDNDVAGYKVMIALADKLKDIASDIRWLPPLPDAPKGWDWADADWAFGPEEAKTYAKANITAVPEHGTMPVFPDPKIEEPEAPILPAADDAPPTNPPIPLQEEEDPDRRFKFLGWDKSETGKATYHFYSYDKKAIISAGINDLNTNKLIELAPLSYWEMTFPGKKDGFSLQASINWIVRNSDLKGPFNPSIRGRGAWMDRGRVVVHNGPYLLVDGKAMDLEQIESRHIYENGKNLGFELVEPLSAKEGQQLFDLVSMLNWEREINSALLLGWCVLAPICGALQWRPHIWLTGPSGSGKSWVFLNIVRRMLGGNQLAVQGDSTEAGLRQTLGHDAIPVVFDEAENEDERAKQRIQNVLALMRTASADDGGLLVKGSAGGHAKSFRIRSCFAYASIVVQVTQQADRNRVTILGLVKKTGEEAQERFEKLVKGHTELVTDEFVKRLQSRTVQMMPIILENISIFRAAATAELGDARSGDQLGTLLAGAYSLISDRTCTYDEAVGWLTQNEWIEERGLDLTKDETALLNHILERKEMVEINGTRYDRTIGELIGIAAGKTLLESSENIMQAEAQKVLGRMGVMVMDMDGNPGFVISNSHTRVKEWLSRTSWAHNHNKLLQRLTGAQVPDKSIRFISGGVSRVVWLPLHYVTN